MTDIEHGPPVNALSAAPPRFLARIGALRPEALPALPPASRKALLVAGVAALTATAAVLRLDALSAPYWIDEGISVGIASHHLAAIPGLLREDGSPPLYYVLLHGWISLFGAAPAATHLLS